MATLNPDISEVSIGIRELRKVTIYPLSVAHQLKVKGLVSELFNLIDSKPKFTLPDLASDSLESEMGTLIAEENAAEGTADFMAGIADVVSDSLEQLIEFITDPEDKVTLSDITNNQYADILVLVVQANFEAPGKKLKGVIAEVKKLFLSKK